MAAHALLLAVALVTAGSSSAHARQAGWAARRGVVVDEVGAVIPGAQVTVRSALGGVLRQAVTASDGTFAFDRLPPGSYLLEAKAPQFEPASVSLDVDGSEAPPLRVVLGLARLEGEITVTAARGMAGEVDHASPIVTVREADGFHRGPLATIGNAVEGATGVMVQQSTYGQASPFLRGLTGYQVLNLVDGIRFNNTTFRSGPNQYLALIDPSQGQRVEVVLGPASAQYGSDAMGGAIQVLTPPVDFSGAAGWLASGGVSLFANSADRSVGADATVFLRGPGVAAMIGAAERRLDDLRAGRGRDSHHVLRRLFGLSDSQIAEVVGDRQQGTGFTQSGVHGKATARLGGKQSVTAWYQWSDQDDVRAYKDVWGGLGRLQSDFVPQQLRFFYTRYERLDVGRLDWLSGTFSINSQRDGSVRQNLRASDPVVRDDVKVAALGYAVQAGVRFRDRHVVVFGGEVYDEHVDARRDETTPSTGTTVEKRALYPDGSRYVTSGVFVQDEVELVRGEGGRALVARLGGRFTRVDVRTDADENRDESGASLGVVDSQRSYGDWAFSAAVTSRVNDVVSLHALAGRGFRAPNLNDLGALGLNDLGYEVPAESTIDAGALIGTSDGEGALSTGHPAASLVSESLLNYELGLALTWPRLDVRVQGFDAELTAPIVRRSLLFPIGAPPGMLAGVPVTPIAPTAAQREQGVVSVAAASDPRAVKAFVNEGRARYYGLDARLRYRASPRWSADANYSYLVGRELDPPRPVRRLPPQQGHLAVRYQPGGFVSWVEASAMFGGPQERLSGGDSTDERIGAARRRSDITDFFLGGLISGLILPGADGQAGTADDLFGPTGETVAAIRNRVLPIGATINGVTVVDDATRVPLYTRTPGFASVSLRAGLTITGHLDATLAITNVFDRSYRVHGSGVDAPGRSAFAGIRLSF